MICGDRRRGGNTRSTSGTTENYSDQADAPLAEGDKHIGPEPV